MHCIYCKEPLAPGASFCAKCGRSAKENMNTGAPGIVCPNCRAVLPAGTQVCVNCGGTLTAQAAQHSPNPASNPQPARPRAQIPEGYVLDPRSGRYYTATPGTDPATGAPGMHYTWFIPGTGEYQHSFSPSAQAAGSARAPQSPRSGGKGKAGVFLILLPLIALLVGGLAAVAQAGGFRGEEEIPQGIAVLSIDPADMPGFQPVDGDDPVQVSGGGAGANESTQDPFSGALLDPYGVRSFWGNSNDIGSFSAIMGLSYNASETERLMRQADFELEVYTGPFDHVLPATDKAECYAYVTPGGTVFRFDYKYYVSASASPQEVADTYYAAVDAMGTMTGNTKDLESYSGVRDGFTYDEIVEHVAAGMEEYSFQTGFGAIANPDDCSSVLLLQRDGVLSLMMQWTLPLDESATSQGPSSSGESSGASGSPSDSGGVAFNGLVLDQEDAWYEEGLVQLADYGATPNGSGGYDCYVTIYNGTPDMTKLAIDVWLYGGYEEADIIPLAEPAAFNSGDSQTFHFTISSPPASGIWEVLVKYRFW